MKTVWILLLMVLFAAPVLADGYFVITPLPDATVGSVAVLIADENQFRESLSCTNQHATVSVRWGNANVADDTGQRFPPGTSIEIRARGAVYMVSEGADVTVSCTVEAR